MKHNPLIKHARRSVFAMTGIALVATSGLVMTAAPSQAATATPEGDFNFTVVAKDLAYADASFSVEERERLTVRGSTQLTWWSPNHNIKVTKKAVRNAPHLKVRYTSCSRQSKSIAKQAHGASIVVAMPGSVICNTGKNGNIIGGFKWTVKVPAVLKWNSKLKLYEHVYNIVGGKLVKTCKNRMGGHVDVMYPSVVQVRYEQDVKESGKAVAKAAVEGTVTFSITCPNGANFNTVVTTSAEAYASSSIFFTERTRVSVLDAKKVELTHDLKADGDVKALAKAETKIQVSGSCGSQEQEEHQNPTGEIFFGEHAVDLYGTMPVFGRVKAFDGATPVLGSPVVTPGDLGMVSNWRPVSTNKDGDVCETGWVCYMGTFRVTKSGTPGTYVYGNMVATATDNKDGEFTTQPKQFSVFYADHPET